MKTINALFTSLVVILGTLQPIKAQRALGTFILGAQTTEGCPSGFTCHSFTVNCRDVPPLRGVMADQKPTVQIKAVVMFFSGAGGGAWLGSKDVVLTSPFFQSLLDKGFELVQVKWGSNGWLGAAFGVKSGQEALACRPATVIKWVHGNLYAPLGLRPGIGHAGFAIAGISAGSAAIAYALSEYGIDSLVDVAVPISGPPFDEICKGCLQSPGLAYDHAAATLVDAAA
jgi:hypothetical protein